MSQGNPERRRLQKDDAKLIEQALEARGFEIHKSENRVEAWCPNTGRYICGFYWQSATKASDSRTAMPSGWRFDLALADCFSLKDLKTALNEAKRVRKLVVICRTAWQAFCGSRSDRRWAEYRGHIAALFLRQDPDNEEIP